MRRLGHAEEVAHATLYRASHEPSYTTGAEVAVDGGFLYHQTCSGRVHTEVVNPLLGKLSAWAVFDSRSQG